MKSLVLALILATCSLASFGSTNTAESINTERMIYPLFEVFEHYWLWGEDHVKVYGPKFNPDAREAKNMYQEKGETHILPREFFRETRSLAYKVFRAYPSDTTISEGTAFHVGAELLLTNHHVFSPSRSNQTFCGKFKVKLNDNQREKTLYCKEVLHCNKDLDYCLIEMWPHRWGYKLSVQTPPKLNPYHEPSLDAPTIAIGNTRGFGIHASKGKGTELRGESLVFYAPVFNGNSGGPLFNEKGEVIAVVRAQSKDLMSPSAYNVAIPLLKIKNDLEKALGSEHPALKQIDFMPEPKREEEPRLPQQEEIPLES